ncbi:MAG: hypothetical protein KDF59_04515 [Nitrosomonas sp.]|nr:hypothetical protein [Nitrosomonas sp.]
MEKLVCVAHNKAVTNTEIIAKYFARSHNEIIHALRDLKRDCGATFSKENFIEQGSNDLHWITCAGFLILSGLFMGSRDARFKIIFFDAFAKAQEEISDSKHNIPQTVRDELSSLHAI